MELYGPKIEQIYCKKEYFFNCLFEPEYTFLNFFITLGFYYKCHPISLLYFMKINTTIIIKYWCVIYHFRVRFNKKQEKKTQNNGEDGSLSSQLLPLVANYN